MGVTERKLREKQRRREDIIRAAEAAFFSDNYENVTMEEIANNAELSKGTLYLYFKSKDELEFALAEKGVSEIVNYLQNVWDPTLNGQEQLVEVGNAFSDFVMNKPKYFELIVRFELKDIREFHPDGMLLMEPALLFVVRSLERGQRDGSIIDDISIPEMTVILWSQMLGLLQSILLSEQFMKRFDLKADDMLLANNRMIMWGISKGGKRPPIEEK